jgi:hypothetical protein
MTARIAAAMFSARRYNQPPIVRRFADITGSE